MADFSRRGVYPSHVIVASGREKTGMNHEVLECAVSRLGNAPSVPILRVTVISSIALVGHLVRGANDYWFDAPQKIDIRELPKLFGI